uniref:Uncharacterized protein n=1 Tax=Paramormyrops kingsleyae TaxID=1676925 RepID=A0A3B3S1X0_9TELE
VTGVLKNIIGLIWVGGEVLLPDAFGFPAVGVLLTGAVLFPPSDLHGDSGCGERPLQSAAVPGHLHRHCVGVHFPPFPASTHPPHHSGCYLPGGGGHVLAWLGDGGSGGHFPLHPGLPAGRGDWLPGSQSPHAPHHACRGPCRRGDRLQRGHHGDLHGAPLLLCHRAFRQVRSDCGHQHGRLNSLHPHGQRRPAGYLGTRALLQALWGRTEGHRCRGCGGGIWGCTILGCPAVP